jgi:hypothetical protein
LSLGYQTFKYESVPLPQGTGQISIDVGRKGPVQDQLVVILDRHAQVGVVSRGHLVVGNAKDSGYGEVGISPDSCTQKTPLKICIKLLS